MRLSSVDDKSWQHPAVRHRTRQELLPKAILWVGLIVAISLVVLAGLAFVEWLQ
jgi:hypothetical protein